MRPTLSKEHKMKNTSRPTPGQIRYVTGLLGPLHANFNFYSLVASCVETIPAFQSILQSSSSREDGICHLNPESQRYRSNRGHEKLRTRINASKTKYF
jgi:hypothetical protein